MKRRFTKLTAFILAITLTLPFTVFAAAQDEKATSDSYGAHLHIEIYLSNADSPTAWSDVSRKDLIINPYDFYYSAVNFTGTPY